MKYLTWRIVYNVAEILIFVSQIFSNLSNYEIDKKKLDLHTNNIICLETVEKYIYWQEINNNFLKFCFKHRISIKFHNCEQIWCGIYFHCFKCISSDKVSDTNIR